MTSVHTAPAVSGTPGVRRLFEALSIVRSHIILIAMAASIVFGWLATGRHLLVLSLVVGLDWFLINLMNRLTDVEEDQRNEIAGTALVARYRPALLWGSIVLMAASFAVTHLLYPALTPWRLAVQGIGLGYNYRLVPTPRGFARFKEIYFLKNFGSAVLFVLTCFVFPLVVSPERLLPWESIALLVLFFVPFEITYEILYDLRDLEGDRAEGIPTYPVVHGPERALSIINVLLVASSGAIVAGILSGLLGVREGLFLVAPLVQFVFYRPRVRRGLTSRDCVLLTHLGTAQLLLFLAGTAVWQAVGLPENVYLW